MRHLLLALLIGLIPVHSEAAKITFDDLYSFPSIGDPQVSPDGLQIAFVVTTNDLDMNESQSHIWVMASDGSGLRQLTFGAKGESNPRWSPKGSAISFLADRGDGRQIWLLPMNGGEPRQITNLCTGVKDARWSEDGASIVFRSAVFPDCSDDGCNAQKLAAANEQPTEARMYDHLLFRHYDHWFDGRVDRLFVHDFVTDSTYQLTFTHNAAPISSIGGHSSHDVSPDGKEVCYETNTDSMPVNSTNSDVFTAAINGGSPVRISAGKGFDGSPLYSPDGKYLSYLSMAREGYESDQTDLILFDLMTNESANLTESFDRSVGQYLWHPSSNAIYFLAIDRGFSCIWSVDVATGEISRLLDGAVCGNLSMSPDGSYLAVTRSLSDQPNELHRYDLADGKLTRLTHLTDSISSNLDLSRPQEFWFPGFNGDSVHGFLTLPPDFDASRKYPLVLLIHGGPQWTWLGDFNYYGWNTQLVAAQGYVVAQIDPHGSVGYGLAFTEYISGNWGKGDFEDLMLGVDYLIAEQPYIDSTRMAALGRSYGGFMVNWICGHTDRFKCLISTDGSYDHISDYGSTDELWFPEWEMKGTPWTNRDEYVRSSPATYSMNFRTPTLVTHGGHDYRVDPSEGFQMFTALQRQGIPSELLFFPDDGHSLQKLQSLRFVYEKQFEWLARWLKE
jgi:dipeptidyl aminopeptidase/acylaminoacyl peptidase